MLGEGCESRSRSIHTYRVTGMNWIRQIWNRWRRHPDGLAVNRIAVAEPVRNVCAVHATLVKEIIRTFPATLYSREYILVSSTRPVSTHLYIAFLDTTRSKTNRCGDGHLKNSLDRKWFSEFVKHWYSWRAEKNRARWCVVFPSTRTCWFLFYYIY